MQFGLLRTPAAEFKRSAAHSHILRLARGGRGKTVRMLAADAASQ